MEQSKISYKKHNKDSLCTNKEVNLEADYLVAGPNMDTDRPTSAEETIKIYNEFSNVFISILCFKGTFYSKWKKANSHTKVHHDW